MKINKIAAGITATTLFLGLGGAASATIVADPALTITNSAVESTDNVTFTLANVLVGCTVTTKLGGKTVSDIATATASGADAADVGEILSQTIEAPYYAGAYDLTSKVASNCAEDGNKYDTETVTVGEEVVIDTWDSRNLGNAQGLYTIKIVGTLSADTNRKVFVSVRGKTAAHFKTKNDGDFSVVIPGKYFVRGADDYTVKFSFNDNTDYFFDNASIVATVRR